MKIIYIRETEETCDVVKRITTKIKRIFNIIKIENNNNNIIYFLPIYKSSKISKFKIKKLSNKTNKLLDKYGITTIALSEYLISNKILKNNLYRENINILDGKYLFKCLSNKILEYIFNIKNRKIELRRNINAN